MTERTEHTTAVTAPAGPRGVGHEGMPEEGTA